MDDPACCGSTGGPCWGRVGMVGGPACSGDKDNGRACCCKAPAPVAAAAGNDGDDDASPAPEPASAASAAPSAVGCEAL